MVKRKSFAVNNLSLFIKQCIAWAESFSHYCFLNGNDFNLPFGNFPKELAVGSSQSLLIDTSVTPFEALSTFIKRGEWSYGYLSYDLKNYTEKLSSNNKDNCHFPEISFFSPIHRIFFNTGTITIESFSNCDEVFQTISSIELPDEDIISAHRIATDIDKDSYIEAVNRIKNHIIEGDVYELNYCIEFNTTLPVIYPPSLYYKLNALSPMPFSGIYKASEHYIFSASPERFIKKENNKLISQPIKGTAKRSENEHEDQEIKKALMHSEKEQAENMMIVDLVRNDLARSSKPGTVKVEELFGVYTFPFVHQMISTISSELREDVSPVDAIKNAFPMGSMTGAPKIRAMQLIEEFEQNKRGAFSGALGYFSPEGDFDFNVLIRSFFYNQSTGILSFQVGSAITYDSDPEKEYQECLLKASALMKALGA
ncbi:MAG TPA: anthranilate synthase component I family protein [Cytophagaceae bacterium]